MTGLSNDWSVKLLVELGDKRVILLLIQIYTNCDKEVTMIYFKGTTLYTESQFSVVFPSFKHVVAAVVVGGIW